MNTELSLLKADYEAQVISASETAIALKNIALEKAGLIGRVSNASENDTAVKAQTELDSLIRSVEKARKKTKEPFLEMGKKIDAAAADFIADVTQERNRISGLVGDFAQLEQARIRAAEQAARLEAERVERERQNELRRVAEAQADERRRQQSVIDEAAAAERNARNERERLAAETARLEAERFQALSEAKSHEAFDAVNEQFNERAASAELAKPKAIRAEGQIVKPDWEINVVNPYDLARYHPACVTITAKLGEIKALLTQGVTVKGVTAKPIVKAQTSTRRPQAIDV